MSLPDLLKDPVSLRGYRWFLALGSMLCGSAIFWYGFAIGIFLPSMRDDLGLRPSQEGLLSSSYFLGSFVFTIPLTNYLSRFPPVKLMGLVLLACTALFFVAAAVPVYEAQVAIRFLMAVLFVANNPVRTLIIHVWFRPDEYALANGASNSTYGIIESAAFWSTAPLLALFGGWQEMFVFFGVLSALSTAIWLLLARDRPAPVEARELSPAQATKRTSPLRVMLRRDVWYMGIVAVGGGMTWATFITFWPTLARDEFGLSENMSGLVMGFASIGIIPSSLAAPYLLGRLGRRMPLIVAATVLQVPTFTLLLITPNVPFLVLISLFQGLSWVYFPIVLTAPFQVRGIAQREIAVATAFIIVLNMAALTIGPGLAGVLAETLPLRTVLFAFSFGPLISTIGAVLLGEAEPGWEEATGEPSRPPTLQAAG